MDRINLKCVKCGGSDFEVYSSIVPSGVRLDCKCGCRTALGVFDNYERFYEVNGDCMLALYEESYMRDIDSFAIKEAWRSDRRSMMGEDI